MFMTPVSRGRLAIALMLIGAALVGCRSIKSEVTTQAGCDSCAAPAAIVQVHATPPVTEQVAISNERYHAPPANPTPPALPQPQQLPPQVVTAQKPSEPLTPPSVVTDPAVTIPPVKGNVRIVIDTPARRSFPDITAKPEFHHAPDYTELTGELSFVTQKNQWRLRYASIDEEDRYGGSVTLDAHHQLREFRSGQIVRVTGNLVDKESRDPAPLYRVTSVTLVRK